MTQQRAACKSHMRVNQSVKIAVLIRTLRGDFTVSQGKFATISGTTLSNDQPDRESWRHLSPI